MRSRPGPNGRRPRSLKCPDLQGYSIGDDPGILSTVAVESDSAVQKLPVAVHEPAELSRDANAIILRILPWSMHNGLRYQRRKNQVIADALGRRVVSINTIGQGPGSPDLTESQRKEFHRGISHEAGKVMVEAGGNRSEAGAIVRD